MNNTQHITIIGAGLCGSLLALRLAQRGYHITVYEKRPDLRKSDISAGRSINLAFSNRGNKAIKLVGLEAQVKALCIPMYGRIIHDKKGQTFQSNYSGRKHEYINSISRTDLNSLLLNEAETHKNVTIHFNQKCNHVDFKNTTANFTNYITKAEHSVKSDTIIATDGAGSILRKSYYLKKAFLFSFSQNYLTHGYKELHIPPSSNGKYKTTKNALHIWPRGDFMLIALPNLDGSFTVTLFLSYAKGVYNFNNLNTPELVNSFFKTEFPDALALMPNLAIHFFKNPTTPLGTIKCAPWHYKSNTLLMGDAAHAIVPFYGQGMNASFEDVYEFDKILEQHSNNNWEAIYATYQDKRKKDTDAIANLAIDNFHEMKDHVARPIFKEKRKLEMALEETFPKQYASKYALVTFNEHIGYHEAMTKGRAQDKAVLNLIANKDINYNEQLDKKDLNTILEKVKTETDRILQKDKIAGF